jgi:hypothetical protein
MEQENSLGHENIRNSFLDEKSPYSYISAVLLCSGTYFNKMKE